jgi:hypothetical protein
MVTSAFGLLQLWPQATAVAQPSRQATAVMLKKPGRVMRSKMRQLSGGQSDCVCWGMWRWLLRTLSWLGTIFDGFDPFENRAMLGILAGYQ